MIFLITTHIVLYLFLGQLNPTILYVPFCYTGTFNIHVPWYSLYLNRPIYMLYCNSWRNWMHRCFMHGV